MKLLDFFIDVALRSGTVVTELAQLRQQGRGTQKSFLGLTGQTATMAKRLLGAGAAMLALTKAFRTVTRVGSDYETGMKGVQKTTGLADDEIQKLERDLIKLSRIPDIGSTTVELMELAQVAGTLGINGRADLLLFAETMGKLKVASDGKIVGEVAAQSVANIIKASGEGIGNIDRLASSITFLGNNYAVNESQILSSSTNIAKSLRRFRPASSDVVALGTAFAEMKISPELAGTAISKTMNTAEKAVAKGGKALAEFKRVTGLTTDQIKLMLEQDASGLFAAFATGLNRVQSEGESLTTVLGNLKLDDIRTGDTLKSIATEAETMNKALRDSERAFKSNTALDEEAAVAGATYAKSKQGMAEALKGLADTIASSGLIALMTEIVNGINFTVSAVDDFLNSGHPLLAMLDWTAAGFALILPAAILLAKALIFVAIPAFKALGSAMFANPIGLIILAVYALVLAFKNWRKIVDMAKKVGSALLDLGTKIFGPQFDEMIVLTQKLGEIFGKFLWGHIKRVVKLITQLFTGDFKGAWQSLQDIVSSYIGAVIDVLSTLYPNAAASFKAVYASAKEWLQDKLGAVFDWAQGKIDMVKGWFKGLFKNTDEQVERARLQSQGPPPAPFGGGTAGGRPPAPPVARTTRTTSSTVTYDQRVDKIEVNVPVRTNASATEIARKTRNELGRNMRGASLDSTA